MSKTEKVVKYINASICSQLKANTKFQKDVGSGSGLIVDYSRQIDFYLQSTRMPFLVVIESECESES